MYYTTILYCTVLQVSVVHTQPSSAGDIGLRTEQDTIKRVTPVLRYGQLCCSNIFARSYKYFLLASTVLHSAIAGPTLANKLLSLCLSHYQLASTTVTGIPMKEEQNASRWVGQYSPLIGRLGVNTEL